MNKPRTKKTIGTLCHLVNLEKTNSLRQQRSVSGPTGTNAPIGTSRFCRIKLFSPPGRPKAGLTGRVPVKHTCVKNGTDARPTRHRVPGPDLPYSSSRPPKLVRAYCPSRPSRRRTNPSNGLARAGSVSSATFRSVLAYSANASATLPAAVSPWCSSTR